MEIARTRKRMAARTVTIPIYVREWGEEEDEEVTVGAA